MRGIHRSPVDSPHKGQWHRALMFSLICARTNGWTNNRDAVDLRRHRAHCDVAIMEFLPQMKLRIRHHRYIIKEYSVNEARKFTMTYKCGWTIWGTSSIQSHFQSYDYFDKWREIVSCFMSAQHVLLCAVKSWPDVRGCLWQYGRQYPPLINTLTWTHNDEHINDRLSRSSFTINHHKQRWAW